MNVHQSLSEFVENFCSFYPVETRTIEFDSEWPSPCVDSCDCETGNMINWSPVIQTPKQTFDNVEKGLGLDVHPDVKALYTSFWSDNLNAFTSRGSIELLQPWNENDFARLQENLIGHVLMKRRLKQPVTLFVGLTENEEYILSVDNDSGNVMLEQVGKLPTQVVAQNLAEFIGTLRFIPF